MFLESGSQVSASLSHIREVACFTCQAVDPTFVVGGMLRSEAGFVSCTTVLLDL